MFRWSGATTLRSLYDGRRVRLEPWRNAHDQGADLKFLPREDHR